MTEQEWYSTLEMRHGKELQQKFSSACVAICGLGGLGSNAAISLARAGVGKLILIDFDKVDISNLHRQQYNVSQLGMYKTDAMKQTLSEIAPYCKIVTHTEKITEDNLSLIADCDIVCECFDNAECKSMLVNGVAEQYPDKYIISASGMSGLHTGNIIQTKKLGKRL
jgi:sulfur carrier protein ThiS adenylyltransferase